MTFMLILVVSLAMWGCGSDSYDEPDATQTDSPLISAATLYEWMEQGLVNNNDGWEKVVIIDYGNVCPIGPIPGACRVMPGDLRDFRVEGVAEAAAMVATGSQMDAVIQSCGIDENTTIVFTTGDSNFYPTRAYWTFRYWGFPKSRLKVLDGGNAAWVNAEYEIYNMPAVSPSTYSVCNNGVLRGDLRASLGEMITMVQSGANGDTALTIDARGNAGYDGETPTTRGFYELLLGTEDPYYVVFEGHPRGGQCLEDSLYDPEDGTYLSVDALTAIFELIGWDSSMMVYAYCASGYGGSRIFFVMDALLNAPVQLYDGSWSQWGQMATIDTNGDVDEDPEDGIGDEYGGMLPVGSPWATDVLTDSGVDPGPTYNTDDVDQEEIERLRLRQGDLDLSANQIEDEDTAYIQGTGGGAPTLGGGDAGGGC